MNKIEKMLFDESVKVANLLANGKFKELQEGGYFERISKDDILTELHEYGGVISTGDSETYEKGFYYYRGPLIYDTELDLMIDGSPSDLTLMCEIELDESQEHILRTIIDDLHVL